MSSSHISFSKSFPFTWALGAPGCDSVFGFELVSLYPGSSAQSRLYITARVMFFKYLFYVSFTYSLLVIGEKFPQSKFNPFPHLISQLSPTQRLCSRWAKCSIDTLCSFPLHPSDPPHVCGLLKFLVILQHANVCDTHTPSLLLMTLIMYNYLAREVTASQPKWELLGGSDWVLGSFISPGAPNTMFVLSAMSINICWQLGQIIKTSDSSFTMNIYKEANP